MSKFMNLPFFVFLFGFFAMFTFFYLKNKHCSSCLPMFNEKNKKKKFKNISDPYKIQFFNEQLSNSSENLVTLSKENTYINTNHKNIKELPQKNSCSITFVSAYFKVPSKHSDQSYEYWMSNLLSNSMCMVFYYDAQILPSSENAFNLVDFLLNYAQETTMISIPVVLNQVAYSFFNKSEEFWNFQTKLDPEIHIHHTYFLYWIWGLKSHFLQEVALSNPFQSQVFLWLDAGYLRDGKYCNQNWLNLQVPTIMKKIDKIFVLLMRPFEEVHKKLNKNNKTDYDFTNENHLGGGAIVGSANKIKQWTKSYKDTFEYYISINRFVGKDQNIFATMCLSDPDLCYFIPPDYRITDPWFSVIPFITGEYILEF